MTIAPTWHELTPFSPNTPTFVNTPFRAVPTSYGSETVAQN
jgi:hypothetical protein